MNIYKVEQDSNAGYDTYDSFICVAENEQEARETHPSEFVTHSKNGKWYGTYSYGNKDEYEMDSGDWVRCNQINKLSVTLIGVANENQPKGIVLSSFNAG